MHNDIFWVSYRHLFTTANKILFSVALLVFIVFTAIKSSYDGAVDYLTKVQSSVIGADVLLKSSDKIDFSKDDVANLFFSEKVSYKTVIINNGNFGLVDLIAIDNNFPLVGDVILDENIKHKGDALSEDVVWLDSRAIAVLNTSIGDVININNKDYKVGAKVKSIPQSASLTSISPKVVIKKSQIEDVLKSPGLRVEYEYLFSGPKLDVDRLISAAKSKNISFKRADDSSMVSNRAINRLDIILRLSLVFEVVVSACLWVYCLRYYQLANHGTIKIYSNLGVTSSKIASYYLVSGVLTLLIAILLGSGIGALISNRLLVSLLNVEHILLFPLLDIVILGSFLFVLYLNTISKTISNKDGFLNKILSLFLVILLTWYYLGQNEKLWQICLGTLGGFIAVYLLVYVFYNKVMLYLSNTRWHIRYATIQIQRYSKDYTLFSSIMILIISLCTAFVYINKTISNDWGQRFSDNIPNYFFIDIPKDSNDKFSSIIEISSILYPSISAKLYKVNGEVLLHPNATGNGRKGYHRDLKISSFRDLKSDNEVISGKWFDKDSKGEVSIESGFAKRMKINLGDTITMKIGSKSLSAKVTSVRSVDWQDMTPNFFLIFSPEAFKELPYTYMTSMYISPDYESNIRNLVQSMPMVSIFDSKMIISNVLSLVDKLSFVMYMFTAILIILLFVALALIIACQFKKHEKEWQLLTDIGIKFSDLRKYLVFEYSMIGLVTGFISIILSLSISSWLLSYVFDLSLGVYQIQLAIIFSIVIFLTSIIIGRIIASYLLRARSLS